MNLVPSEPGFQYIALSYIWGAAPSCCTTLENLSTLLEKDSFRRPTIAIPQVIREAMDWSKLWVKGFCGLTGSA
jgi:hypothetical protein